MNEFDMNALFAVLLGFLLRFGVPLLLTGLAAWGLRRLDHQWQMQAEHSQPARSEGCFSPALLPERIAGKTETRPPSATA